MVLIYDRAEEQRVKEKESLGFAGTASQWIETDYDGVVRPFFLTSEQHTTANAYSIANIPAIISYLHAYVGFPVIATWIYTINKGWYRTWTGLTSSRVWKHLSPSRIQVWVTWKWSPKEFHPLEKFLQ